MFVNIFSLFFPLIPSQILLIPVWYADNETATGHLNSLRNWCNMLVTLQPAYAYHIIPCL